MRVPESLLSKNLLGQSQACFGGSQAPLRRFLNSPWHGTTYTIHSIYHIIWRNHRLHPSQGHICCQHGMNSNKAIALYTGHLHQTSHRITSQPQEILNRQGHTITNLLRISPCQLYQGRRSHTCCCATFRLTSAIGSCNGSIGLYYHANTCGCK